MAHAGKQFPVVERRDFNLNVLNNNEGFAHRYIVLFKNLPPGIGHALVGTQWDCGPDGVDPLDRMFWASDPDIIGPFAYDVILEASIVNNREFDKRVLIREAISGVILEAKMIDDPEPHKPGFPFFRQWSVIFHDPFFFGVGGFPQLLDAAPKRWVDGPPH